MTSGFAQFFGGTSLLIMVGVVLDTLQQVESYLLIRRNTLVLFWTGLRYQVL